MVQPEGSRLSLRRQCDLLYLSRSSLYYEPVEVSEDELALMKRIDRLCLEHPYYGSRRVTAVLQREGLDVNRKRTQRLMREMGCNQPASSRASRLPLPPPRR